MLVNIRLKDKKKHTYIKTIKISKFRTNKENKWIINKIQQIIWKVRSFNDGFISGFSSKIKANVNVINCNQICYFLKVESLRQ